MLATNSNDAKEAGCSPVSSNCVIWNGPDLDCIGLCKGDSISVVIAKMAEELCALLEMFDLQAYDLSCFVDCPTPSDFQELIQVLIDKICALENIPATGSGGTGDCPDNCIVNIAQCFYYTNPTGDTVTTMTLVDYVTAIGNQICSMLTRITNNEAAITALQSQGQGFSEGIQGLQVSKASVSSLQYQNLPEIDPTLATKYILEGVRDIEESYVSQLNAVGVATKLFQSILPSAEFNDEERLSKAGPYGSDPAWVSVATNLADVINNFWILHEDTLAAIRDIQNNCCAGGCGDIHWNFRATLDTSGAPTIYVNLFFDGTLDLTGFRDTDPLGTIFTITDSAGNSSTSRLNVVQTSENPSGFAYQIDPTPLDHTLDLTVTVFTSVYNPDTNTTCDSPQTFIISGNVACPSVTLTPFINTIAYSFATTPGFDYTVELFEGAGTIAVATNVHADPPGLIQDSFTGLLDDTNYEVQVTIINTAGEKTICARAGVTTIAAPCLPPYAPTTQITIP